MSELGGNNFASGAAEAGLNEIVINELANLDDPAFMQWASAIIGGAASKAVGGDAQSGASIAASGTKNNWVAAARVAAVAAFRYLSSTPAGRAALQKLEVYSEEALLASQEMMAKVMAEATVFVRTGNFYAGRAYNGTRNIAADFVNGSRLTKHFKDHNGSFGFANEQEYLKAAKNFLEKAPTSTTQTFTSNTGWYFRYDTATNEFGIINEFGGISTYFKPGPGLNYWVEQVVQYAPK
jgi:hypothetical protein